MNLTTGKGHHVYLTNSVFTKNHVYRRSEFIPMHPADEMTNGFGGGNGHCIFQYLDDQAIWTLKDENIDARLVAADYHTPIDI